MWRGRLAAAVACACACLCTLLWLGASLMGLELPLAAPPTRVVCAGLIRSGSTWQFNAVRIILEMATGKRVTSAHGHNGTEILRSCSAAEVCVMKIHEFDASVLAGSEMVLVSHRDLRDSLLSTALMFGACLDTQPFSTSLLINHTLVHMFGHFEAWAKHAAYSTAYAAIVEDPVAEIGRIAAALRAKVDAREVKARLDEELASSLRRVKEQVALARREALSAAGGADGGKGAGSVGALRWDAKTALSESHTHAFTKAPGAFRRAGVLAYLRQGNGRLRVNCACSAQQSVCLFRKEGQAKWFKSQRPCVPGPSAPRRLPICDFGADLRRIEERYGGWLAANGYDVRPVAHLTHVVSLFDAQAAADRYGVPASRLAVTSAVLSWRRAALHAAQAGVVVKLVLVAPRPRRGEAAWPPVSRALLGEQDVLVEVADGGTGRGGEAGSGGERSTFLGEGVLLDPRAVWRAAQEHVHSSWVVFSGADCVVSAEFYRAAFKYVQHRTLPHDRLALSLTRTVASPDLGLGRGRADTYVLRHTLHGPRDSHDLFVFPAPYLGPLAVAAPAAAAEGTGAAAGERSRGAGEGDAQAAQQPGGRESGGLGALGELTSELAPFGCIMLSALRSLGAVEILRESHWALQYAVAPSFDDHTLRAAPFEAHNWRHGIGWLANFGLARGQCCAAVARAGEAAQAEEEAEAEADGGSDGADGSGLMAESARDAVGRLDDSSTPECCLGAGSDGMLPANKLLEQEALALNQACAAEPPPPSPLPAAASMRPFGGLRSELVVLIVYERILSGTEGSDVRLTSVLHYLLAELNATVHFLHRAPTIVPLHATGAELLGARGRRVHWHVMDETLSGLNATWLMHHGVDAVIACLWFYRLGLTPLPSLVVEPVRAARMLSARNLPLAVLTDDVHWLRRQSVGDSPVRVARVRALEAWLASHPHIDAVLTVSEQDEYQYLQLRGGHADEARLPSIETVPYASASPAPLPRLDPVRRKRQLAQREFITFVGTPHRSNQKDVRWFLTKVLPIVSQRLRDLPRPRAAKVALIGGYRFVNTATGKTVNRNWTAEVDEITSAASRSEEQVLRDVECFGQVQADTLRRLLQRSRVVVNPVQFVGSGISTKVLTGMEAQVPVVTTTVSGLRCIADSCTGVKYVPRGDAQAFAEAVVNVLVDDEVFEEVVHSASRQIRLQLSLRSYKDLGVFERFLSRASSAFDRPSVDDGAVHVVMGFDPRVPWTESDQAETLGAGAVPLVV